MTISGGGDDAVKFGSDYSRSKIVDSFDINVTNSVVGSNGCNALQFGSETLGDFHDFLFENITVTAVREPLTHLLISLVCVCLFAK